MVHVFRRRRIASGRASFGTGRFIALFPRARRRPINFAKFHENRKMDLFETAAADNFLQTTTAGKASRTYAL